MTAADILHASTECELLLDLLSRHKSAPSIAGILRDTQDIRRLLHLHSFRKSESAERLFSEISSRYRKEILALSSGSVLLCRQSSSVYLRLEQLLGQLVRVALLRLSREGVLPISHTQLMHSDGMLLQLIKKELHTKTDG